MPDNRSDTLTNPPSRQVETQSPKSRVLALLMALFFGALGLHRFYVGKFWTGLLLFFTGGGFGIWWLVDVVWIASGRFKDSQNRVLGPPKTSRRQLPRRERVEPATRGTDGSLESSSPSSGEDKVLHVETDDGEEVRLDEDEVMGDPLEKEFAELEKEVESNEQG